MLPHWWNVAIIVFGPPLGAVAAVLLLAFIWKRRRQTILEVASAVSVLVLIAGVGSCVVITSSADEPTVAIINGTPWDLSATTSLNSEPVTILAYREHTFTSFESPFPGSYAPIVPIHLVGGRTGLNQIEIDGNSDDMHAHLIVRSGDGP